MKNFLIIFSIFLLAACASSHDKKHGAHAGPTQILYSPTGDPLNGGPLGRPTCPEAMKHWFERVDTKHDGAITLDEFLADAKTQFQRMDIDKNGYLVSEELERFRLPYREGLATEKPAAAESNQGEQEQPQAGGHHGRGHGGGGTGGGNAPSESGSGSVIDPVMSADTNLDYKVTPGEFTAYSQRVFQSIDADHNGTLSEAEVTAALCGANHDKD